MKQLTASAAMRIPFHDADPAGVVWHGRYPKYLEQARCALLEAVGYSYAEMAASGYVWPVVDMRLRYTRALRYNDAVEIHATLVEWEYRMKIDYRIERAGLEVTRGHTIQVPVDDSGELCIGCPEVFVSRVEKALAKSS